MSTREPRQHLPMSLDDGARMGVESPRVREPAVEDILAEALGSHPWPELPPAPSPSPDALPWPELPPAAAGEPAGVLVELREWERLKRLEREQRGE